MLNKRVRKVSDGMHTKNTQGGCNNPPAPPLGIFNLRLRARKSITNDAHSNNTPVPTYVGTPLHDEL